LVEDEDKRRKTKEIKTKDERRKTKERKTKERQNTKRVLAVKPYAQRARSAFDGENETMRWGKPECETQARVWVVYGL